MSVKFLEIFKENFVIQILLFFTLIFPLILLVGSAVINLSIVLMNIFFLIHIFNVKKYNFFKNNIFYSLMSLWFFLILNTLLNENFNENFSRSFSFIRFIILVFLFAYILTYKDYKFKNAVFKTWSIIFIIVTIDLIFEYIFGFNSLNFKSNYGGRLVGFMDDQLKIGHWYLCFSLIFLSYHFNQQKINFFYKYKMIFFLLLSLLISFIIGERANFIRLLAAITFLIIIVRFLNLKHLLIFIFSIIAFFSFLINYDKSKNNGLIERYFKEINHVLKKESLKEINNNNQYTPLYLNAYDLYKKNKLLGVGPGSYLLKSHENFTMNNKIKGYDILPNTHPHQYHFEILATLGLPGYLFIITFLLYFLIKSFRFYINQKNYINLSSSLFILVFLIPLLPTGSFFTTYGASMFWLNFSLMNLGNFKNMN